MKEDMAHNMANVQQHHTSAYPSEVVHVSSSSHNGLDELFQAVMKPQESQAAQSIPMRQRKFPPSFFKPPSSASSSAAHSRESSLDATTLPPVKQNSSVASKPPTPIAANSPLSPASPVSNHQQHQQAPKCAISPSLTIIHPRARSLPTSLQQFNYSPTSTSPAPSNRPTDVHQMPPQSTVHIRQRSYDTNNMQLPEGWSVSYTPNGERYFLNHKLKITTWDDPRKMFPINNNNNFGQQQFQASSSSSPQPNIVQANGQFEATAKYTTTPLPDGWEQASTPNGNVYYINHNEQSTTWYCPSVPQQLQTKDVLQNQSQWGILPPAYPFQQTITTTNNNNTNSNNNFKCSNGNIPQDLMVALENMNTSGKNASQLADKQQLMQNQKLQQLKLEREKMRLRQEEIMQNSLFKSSFPSLNSSSDPFLSSTIYNQGRQDGVDMNLGSSVNSNNNNHLSMVNSENSILTDQSLLNNHHQQQLLPVEDMPFDTMPLDNIDVDLDILNNVEDLLNANRDNIMTWL